MSLLNIGSEEEGFLDSDDYDDVGVESESNLSERKPNRWKVTDDSIPPESDSEILSEMIDVGQSVCDDVVDAVELRIVDTLDDVDDDMFFAEGTGDDMTQTIVTRYDLEKSIPNYKKKHFKEIDRYWVNKPYAFISLFKSRKDNEVKYYAIEPYVNPIEEQVIDFFSRKLRTTIKYAGDDVVDGGTDDQRRDVIKEKTRQLLGRYNLYNTKGNSVGVFSTIKSLIGLSSSESDLEYDGVRIDGIEARPESALLDENSGKLTPYQVQVLLYYLNRNFIGYERIDPIKDDINVEDISCDGYNEPVFVYHSRHEQIITNIIHGEKQLDDFVVKLAQRSGKGISKRKPQVDATLPDGSRAQLTLGSEVSSKGTNYTIRQFKEVPFTPVDLINWKTFGLDQMAFLWLCIENNKSLLFAGGTASGKTTSLNAVSLFIPSSQKIVSIEDTREVELPQRNWVASVTRPSFSGESGDIDEFALLEAALRQRPDYIVMGEVRGEEGRTLFQVMSTGHTTYTTFHADSVGEVLKRFTTDPINVSKTLFTALDLVSIQTVTRVGGDKVRRNENLTEINHYYAENDEINVQDIYEWRPDDDSYYALGQNNTVRGTATYEEIMFDRGWSEEEAWKELRKRCLILAYLIKENLNSYTEVAATVQAFINDQDTILTLIANDALEERLEDLRDMESVLIDVDPDDEESVPRPEPPDEILKICDEILEETEDILTPYEGIDPETAIVEESLTEVNKGALEQGQTSELEEESAVAGELEEPDGSTDEDGFFTVVDEEKNQGDEK